MNPESISGFIQFCLHGDAGKTLTFLSAGMSLINNVHLPEESRIVAGLAVIGRPLYKEVYEDVHFFESPLIWDEPEMYLAVSLMDRLTFDSARQSREHFLRWGKEASLEEVLARTAEALENLDVDVEYLSALQGHLSRHNVTLRQLNMAISPPHEGG